MTSFPAAARRVRDSSLAPGPRLLSLRECALSFAPYGFRATWHHLLVSSAIPRLLTDDPASLVRAVDELEEARVVWRSHLDGFATRRMREKSLGQRTLRRTDFWLQWGIRHLAYCPDPDLHPRFRLKAVVERLIEAYGTTPFGACPVCGTSRTQQPCPGCGITLRAHLALPPREFDPPRSHRWLQIWRRTAVEATVSADWFRGGRLAALRQGRRLATEVPATRPGRRAVVDIEPSKTKPGSFRLRQWEEQDSGSVLIREACPASEDALVATIRDWDLRPDQFDHPGIIDPW